MPTVRRRVRRARHIRDQRYHRCHGQTAASRREPRRTRRSVPRRGALHRPRRHAARPRRLRRGRRRRRSVDRDGRGDRRISTAPASPWCRSPAEHGFSSPRSCGCSAGPTSSAKWGRCSCAAPARAARSSTTPPSGPRIFSAETRRPTSSFATPAHLRRCGRHSRGASSTTRRGIATGRPHTCCGAVSMSSEAQDVLDALDLPVSLLDNGRVHPPDSRTRLSRARPRLPPGAARRQQDTGDRARPRRAGARRQTRPRPSATR